MSCFADVVPGYMIAEAMSITCLFECIGVFTMPNIAGRVADITGNMGEILAPKIPNLSLSLRALRISVLRPRKVPNEFRLRTNYSAAPIHIAGLLICIGGVFNCIAGVQKARSRDSKEPKMVMPSITITLPSNDNSTETTEISKSQNVKTIS